MDMERMLWWLKWSMVATALVTTAFPFWYGFANRFWETQAGVSILLLSIGVAAAWDLTFVFNFWWTTVPVVWAFRIQMAVHIYTIAAGLYLLYVLWYNRRHGEMVTVKNEKEPT